MHQYKERDGEEDRQPGGHVKRREEGHVLRRMLDAPVPGKRRRGRQTTGGHVKRREDGHVQGEC